MKLTITQMWDDFRAEIAPGKYASGATADEALGRLVSLYPRQFGVKEIAIQPRLPLDVLPDGQRAV